MWYSEAAAHYAVTQGKNFFFFILLALKESSDIL